MTDVRDYVCGRCRWWDKKENAGFHPELGGEACSEDATDTCSDFEPRKGANDG